jgi:hypothetical protein
MDLDKLLPMRQAGWILLNRNKWQHFRTQTVAVASVHKLEALALNETVDQTAEAISSASKVSGERFLALQSRIKVMKQFIEA